MSTTYGINEKVYCFHGPLIYEAKVLKTEDRKDVAEGAAKGMHYFVHYKGWKQTWDEWVPTSRLLKHNEESHAKQKALIEAARTQRDLNAANANAESSTNAQSGRRMGGLTKDGKKKGGAANGAGAAGEAGSKKRARDGELEADYARKPEVKIPIPDVLKVQLVDDWENVTKNHQLVSLPRDPTVFSLLASYKSYAVTQLPTPAYSKRGEQPKALAILTEVLSGLQLYFDKSLGSNLLYRFERQQYVEQRRKHQADVGGAVGMGDEFEASKVYGAEHLLRLFVNLPSFISHTTMDAESVNILRDHVIDFMNWMVKEQKRIFQKDYEPTSPHYMNLSRT